MSQYGMQMPAGQLQRGPTMNIYTGLLLAAVVALVAASAYVFVQGKSIAPGGNPLAVHQVKADAKGQENAITLPD